MRIRVPSKKIRERFLLTYELEGCQKAVNFLSKYYRVSRMRVSLDGKRVNHGCVATYFDNRAYFSKKGLKKRTVLHEFYHHLIYVNSLDMPLRMEEKNARSFARDFMANML